VGRSFRVNKNSLEKDRSDDDVWLDVPLDEALIERALERLADLGLVAVNLGAV
jgi:hypothetical protein